MIVSVIAMRSHLWTGTFTETTSPEHQLHWIIENGKAVRAADGLSNVVEAMKIANWRHDFLRYVDSYPSGGRLSWLSQFAHGRRDTPLQHLC
jgi:hypothetical protein